MFSLCKGSRHCQVGRLSGVLCAAGGGRELLEQCGQGERERAQVDASRLVSGLLARAGAQVRARGRLDADQARRGSSGARRLGHWPLARHRPQGRRGRASQRHRRPTATAASACGGGLERGRCRPTGRHGLLAGRRETRGLSYARGRRRRVGCQLGRRSHGGRRL